MDTSKTYIKMCDCPEIQEQWKMEIGDWIWRNYRDISGFPKEIEDKIWSKDKLEEVQILTYISSIGGYYVAKNTNGESRTFTQEEYLKDRFIWLPRQDQIQEMINYCSTNFICGIYDWFIEIGGEEKEFSPSSSLNSPSPKSASEKTGTTYEQLWLAFYMHEYHKLIWDGAKWIGES